MAWNMRNLDYYNYEKYFNKFWWFFLSFVAYPNYESSKMSYLYHQAAISLRLYSLWDPPEHKSYCHHSESIDNGIPSLYHQYLEFWCVYHARQVYQGKSSVYKPSFADNQWVKIWYFNNAIIKAHNLGVWLTSAHLFGIIRRASLRSVSLADSIFSNRGVTVALGLNHGQGSYSLLTT